MWVKSVAMLWGFGEATVFFIVPDVWLSIVGRDKLKVGLIASLYSLAGALVGGIAMYLWGKHYPQDVTAVMDGIPAIDIDMIARVKNELAVGGERAVLLGPFTGTPYKLYAVNAYSEGITLMNFLLISVPARLVRFFLVTTITHYLVNWVTGKFPSLSKVWLIILAWVIFHVFYFTTM